MRIYLCDESAKERAQIRNCIEKYDIYVGEKGGRKDRFFLLCVYWNSILK